jgi:hypothetical protein
MMERVVCDAKTERDGRADGLQRACGWESWSGWEFGLDVDCWAACLVWQRGDGG